MQCACSLPQSRVEISILKTSLIAFQKFAMRNDFNVPMTVCSFVLGSRKKEYTGFTFAELVHCNSIRTANTHPLLISFGRFGVACSSVCCVSATSGWSTHTKWRELIKYAWLDLSLLIHYIKTNWVLYIRASERVYCSIYIYIYVE